MVRTVAPSFALHVGKREDRQVTLRRENILTHNTFCGVLRNNALIHLVDRSHQITWYGNASGILSLHIGDQGFHRFLQGFHTIV